jgi:hypothetical protein
MGKCHKVIINISVDRMLWLWHEWQIDVTTTDASFIFLLLDHVYHYMIPVLDVKP